MMRNGASNAGKMMMRFGVTSLALTPAGGVYAGPDGRPYMDFPPQETAPLGLVRVPVLTHGGGRTSGTYAQPPSAAKSLTETSPLDALPTVIVLFVGPTQSPYVVGFEAEEGTLFQGGVSRPFTPQDAVVLVGGISALLKSDGTGVLDFPESGTMTISRSGEADGRAASASPVEDYATDVSALLGELITKVNFLIAGDTPTPITTVAPTLAPCRLAALPISADVEG